MQGNQANGATLNGGDAIEPPVDRPSGDALFASGDPPLFADVIIGTDARPCRFLFAHGQLPVIGELRPGAEGSELQLRVVVGRLPYTVESRDQREKMLKIIRAFPTDMGESLVIAQDQSICVSTAAPLPPPLTPAGLLSELVARLVRLDPVLGSLADLLPGLAPALGASAPVAPGDPRGGTAS